MLRIVTSSHFGPNLTRLKNELLAKNQDKISYYRQMDKEDLMVEVEEAAENCTLNLDHIQALNSSNMTVLMRLYNMCIHTWDPENTWEVYYWNELIPPLIIYRYNHINV